MIQNLHISNYTQKTVEHITNETVIYSRNNAIDKLIGCFKLGELICFAGAGGNGKSTLLRSIIYNISITDKIATGYFCSEGIGKERIISQFLYAIAGLSFDLWTLPTISNSVKTKLEQAMCELNNSSLYANLNPVISIDQVEEDAEKLVKDEGVKIFFIDNMQGIRLDDGCDKFRQVSLRLKKLAQQLNVPFVVSSNLNWGKWERADFEIRLPYLYDLSDVGNLNDIADIVLGIYRPELYHISQDELGNKFKGKLRIDVLKSYRNKLNFEYLQFGKNCLSFE